MAHKNLLSDKIIYRTSTFVGAVVNCSYDFFADQTYLSSMHTFKKKLLLLFVLLIGQQLWAQPKTEFYNNYIVRFKSLAITEMERTGIPASIKLAQGLLECNAGRSTLAVQANNHFGIKCAGGWSGPTFYLRDDDKDSDGNLIESCFRKYNDPESSFVDHSEFLRDPKKVNRYGFLFNLDRRDYRKWANGLKQSGYATEQRYADLLITIIEEYQLYRFDMMTAGSQSNPEVAQSGIIVNNDTKMVLARQGETLYGIAAQYDVSVKKLLSYNEGIRTANEQLTANDRVYLQKKKRFFRGRKLWHYVQEGETMYSIAQLYGVRLSKLYSRNRMTQGSQPAVGERIKLRWCIKKADRPRLSTEKPREQPVRPPANITADEGHDDKLQMILDREKYDENYEFELPGNNNQPSTPDKPKPPKEDPPEPTATYYTVLDGDTLYGIAKKFNTTVDTIKALNNLNHNNIKKGIQLRVK
ncbi:MAG: LysM peptidoglycan-binding domain-containing protein [Saprospiraceae bacterium]|nr:LysM peptidoglycan-binding domain-containing protein [Saprospiraceae bacterium]MBP7679544.1 LysM peptidoglycan-binding domain-containing protein [Saprospiraceae bacterium]